MTFLKRFQSRLESLCLLPEKSKYVVAYSGGVDSHVLLYCCAKLDVPVRAVHVHHGLQSVADEWVEHCQSICKQLEIQLDVLYVDARRSNGQSPEEAARNVRYAALSKNLSNDDCLITAQHQNDQAETLLLQLLRTASAAGLAAMPDIKQIDNYFHIRPLLTFSRNEIESFAKDNGLQWVEDPSNQDATFDRNYLRKNVMPLLRNRWPEVDSQLSTVAVMQSSNLVVLEDMAEIDLANVTRAPSFQSDFFAYEIASVLSISAIKKLSNERLYNLLRFWVIKEIKVSPTRNLLQEIEKTIINAQQDVGSVIEFSGFEYRKYQDFLYLLKKINDENNAEDIIWNPNTSLMLAGVNVQLIANKTNGIGLKLDLLKKSLKVCFRQGGEKFHPENRVHSQSLKKLLQEEGVPPWERGSFPLLYCDDELVAVVGLWISKSYAVGEGEDGWVVDVERL